MFWKAKAPQSLEGMELAEMCRIEAEALYRSGQYHCAEAVLETIRRHFAPETPQALLSAVGGFGGGSGSGCICGAVAAGTVAMGLVLRDKKRTTHMTRELHSWFKQKYGATCCKTIRAGQPKEFCPVLTGEVGGRIAEMLMEAGVQGSGGK